MKEEKQRRLFQFLSDHFKSGVSFTMEELRVATGYKKRSFDNYRSKQFGALLDRAVDGKMRVGQAFRRFKDWETFRDEVVSQKRRVMREYRPLGPQRVMSFEFFMPLRNEEWLRESLDSLFYKEEMESRLRNIDGPELEREFPKHEGESEEQHLARIRKWISSVFVGYSIFHVSGRFKIGELKSRGEVAESFAAGTGRYLIDETTAIVRFLFPCGMASDSESQSETIAARIRWFFNKLFVETILKVVNGEDEVWLLESGFRSQLQVYRAKN